MTITPEFLEKLEKKQEKILDEIVEIKIIQGIHNKSLDEHMRRSDALEKQNEHILKELDPVKAHVNRVDGALKLIGTFSLIVSIVAGLVKIYTSF
jgi:hypothetical protein